MCKNVLASLFGGGSTRKADAVAAQQASTAAAAQAEAAKNGAAVAGTGEKALVKQTEAVSSDTSDGRLGMGVEGGNRKRRTSVPGLGL